MIGAEVSAEFFPHWRKSARSEPSLDWTEFWAHRRLESSRHIDYEIFGVLMIEGRNVISGTVSPSG